MEAKGTKYTPQYKMRVKGEFEITDLLMSGKITQQEAFERRCELDKKIDELPFEEVAFDIVGGEPSEGDYVVNTEIKKLIPRKVVKAENGTLGIEPGGWFNFLPLRECHKKIKWRE